MDVLAANVLATAISPVFTPGVNLVRAVFLEPSVRDLYDDREAAATAPSAGRRRSPAPTP
jgi:hypothetical protein